MYSTGWPDTAGYGNKVKRGTVQDGLTQLVTATDKVERCTVQDGLTQLVTATDKVERCTVQDGQTQLVTATDKLERCSTGWPDTAGYGNRQSREMYSTG